MDGTTGLTYGVAGDVGEAGEGVASSELVALITDRLSRAGAGGAADTAYDPGELESVIVTSTRRHHVIFSVGPQEDLLLTAGLDREQTNLALAIRSLGDLAENVLA